MKLEVHIRNPSLGKLFMLDCVNGEAPRTEQYKKNQGK